MTHRPKVMGFCSNCSKFYVDCSMLDFSKMPVIGKDKDGVKVVKCTEFISRKNMPTEKAARPFETGDLVVCGKGWTGKIKLVKTEWNKDTGWREFEKPIIVLFDNNLTQHCSVDDVKCIRKPRKGSKEARNIVAMLARKYRKENAICKDINLYESYLSAKSMLK